MPDLLESPSMLMTLCAFLLVLGPLVVIHELGHYLVGRWFGVRPMPSRSASARNWPAGPTGAAPAGSSVALPLGGYVQFAGDMNAVSMPGPIRR
jgi:regulator of sigma E protease